MTLLSPIDEREDLLDRTSAALRQSMRRFARALVAEHQGEGSKQTVPERDRFRAVCVGVLEYGAILGQRRTLLLADHVRRKGASVRRYPLMLQGVAKVPFREAIEDMASREPRLAGSAAEVRDLYVQGKAFAIARSTEQVLTSRIQTLITGALATGGTVDALTEKILGEGGDDFTRAYAENVYRTNIMTAYTAGQKAMAADPDVKAVIPAFRYSATLDADTRPGHAAIDGLIAQQDSWVWELYSPPIYYNCRCALDFIDVFELEEMGVLNADGTVPDIYPSGWNAREQDQLFAYGG